MDIHCEILRIMYNENVLINPYMLSSSFKNKLCYFYDQLIQEVMQYKMYDINGVLLFLKLH